MGQHTGQVLDQARPTSLAKARGRASFASKSCSRAQPAGRISSFTGLSGVILADHHEVPEVGHQHLAVGLPVAYVTW